MPTNMLCGDDLPQKTRAPHISNEMQGTPSFLIAASL